MSGEKYTTPAFPVLELNQVTGHIDSQHLGLTIRDYFAAHAMAAIWAKLDPSSVRDHALSQTAKHAYVLADAMMEVRKQ